MPSLDAHAHNRPSGAKWPRRLSLRMRLGLSVAVSVAAVVTVVTVVGMQLAQQRLADDLRETALVTAVAVADDIELRPEWTTPEGLSPTLHDFMAAAPSLRSISVFRAGDQGPSLVASTSSVPGAPRALIERAITTGETAWGDPSPHVTMVAVPVLRGDDMSGAVAVGVSLAPVEQLQRAGRLIALVGVTVAIGGITLLTHLLARRMLLAPLQNIADAMRRVTAGDLGARAQAGHADELGQLADDLNRMLAELEDLHHSLHVRVAAGTEELRQRNEQLVRSYESVLQLRETAARAQQLASIGQTMANVAHQIGTPLNLLSGHVQLLQQEIDDPALLRRLRIIDEQVDRVAASVRTLLDRARPQGERRAMNVCTLLTRLRDAMGPRLATGAVRLVAQVGDALPDVMGDETQLELALLNLVANAADAMPQGGVLTIRAGGTGDGVRIEFEDTGAGIPSDLISRIFDPWVTTKPGGHGTGLGLSIARDVITALGGTIMVRSTPGEGSTFTIELPASQNATAQAS
jgi:two-component system NtrC family sensor kinase